MTTLRPTQETYAELQHAYDSFNAELFGGELPECLITLQRERLTYGYFSAERFSNREGRRTDEIAMNPVYFAVVPLVEIMQTLAHEMTHLWQFHHGTPGRGRYHNEEWADKLESIGLMPSSTGQPGGRRTGDRMSDYPIAGGLFLDTCDKLLTQDFRLSWYDRFPTYPALLAGQQSYSLTMDLPENVATVAANTGVDMATDIATALSEGISAYPLTSKKRDKTKYTCPCGVNVWGKPKLRIICGNCGDPFLASICAEEE
ncbi:SprT-like domain-containing protein [Chitinimonas sp. DQS-5]|uniref:SprT-like domain-containing protein n=2 Tax=Parachitinimonas caeni TaxID=3031301 RepID=A0ABT7E4N6_9NEIS|nr:SprT-like domain-containing protein [Parachitinimonas caeni]